MLFLSQAEIGLKNYYSGRVNCTVSHVVTNCGHLSKYTKIYITKGFYPAN